MVAKIKPRRGTQTQRASSTNVLEKDEIALISPDTGSGTGSYKMIVGDGSTAIKDLPIAIDDDITSKEVSSFDSVSDSDPSLTAGFTLKKLFAVIAKKFTYLASNKLDKSSVLDVVNSTNTAAALSANQGRVLQEQIDELNSNFDDRSLDLSLYTASGAGSVTLQVPYTSCYLIAARTYMPSNANVRATKVFFNEVWTSTVHSVSLLSTTGETTPNPTFNVTSAISNNKLAITATANSSAYSIEVTAIRLLRAPLN